PARKLRAYLARLRRRPSCRANRARLRTVADQDDIALRVMAVRNAQTGRVPARWVRFGCADPLRAVEAINRHAVKPVQFLPMPVASVPCDVVPAGALMRIRVRQPVLSAQAVDDKHGAGARRIRAHRARVYAVPPCTFRKRLHQAHRPRLHRRSDQDVELHFRPNMISSERAIQRMPFARRFGGLSTISSSTMYFGSSQTTPENRNSIAIGVKR